MFFRNFALIFVAVNSLFFAHGQTTHTVTVGLLGSFYDPPTVSAEVNDTVTFVFAGPFHTVTQTSVDAPCVPLPGGFNSGVAGIGAHDTSIPSPTWSIRITNASQPIWYFCEITTPSSHCAAGMVGAINPPNVSDYLQFAAAAKLVTGTPAPVPSVALTGVGAFATQSPVTSSSAVLTPSSSTSSSTVSSMSATSSSSQAASTTPSQSSTKSHLGAIIGGAVGGGIGVIIFLIALLWYCGRRKSRDEPLSPSTDDSHFFRYNPGPVRRPSDAFAAAKALENSSVTTFPHVTPPRALSPDVVSPLSPVRRDIPPSAPTVAPRILEPKTSQGFERQASILSSTAGQHSLSERPSTGTINMQVLANEVAAVLMRSPSASNPGHSNAGLLGPRVQRQQNLRVENRSDEDHPARADTPLAPPAYRTAMGSPDHQTAKSLAN